MSLLNKNVLAKLQDVWLEKGISEEERNKRFGQYKKVYDEYRVLESKKSGSGLTLKEREELYKKVLKIYETKAKLTGFSYEVLNNKESDTGGRPIIFAVTHVGKYDVEMVSQAIRQPSYLLSGDFEHLQGTIDSWFLRKVGVFYFNQNVDEERKDVGQRMIEHLKDGGNLLYFPEGTWNMTPNLLLLPCYWGIIDIARASNAIIVPIAAEQYGKRFVINFGKNFKVENYENSKDGKATAITDLRDVMATLKWEIWENESAKQNTLSGVFARDNIANSEWDEYKKKRYNEWPGFSDEYIKRLIFKPKGVSTPEEVFAPIISIRQHQIALMKQDLINLLEYQYNLRPENQLRFLNQSDLEEANLVRKCLI